MRNNDIDISIIIPVYNENNNIVKLIEEIILVIKIDIEIIVVDDCSTDETFKNVKSLTKKYPKLKLIRHNKNYGQSISLRTGILASKKEFIVTIDGDGQNDPKDIHKLIRNYKKEIDFFLVIGNRVNRHDTIYRKVASRLAFFIRKQLLNDSIPDTGCALKLFRKKDFQMLPFFNHIHRFFPVMFKAYNGKVLSVDVGHRERLHGVSKYSNLKRALVGIYDIIGVIWLIKRTINPKLKK